MGIQFAPTDYDGSRFLKAWQSKPPSAWAQVWETILGRDDITERAKEIACPTAVIHGAEDAAFSLEIVSEMGRQIGYFVGATTIMGAPHAAALTHPLEVSTSVRSFIQNLPD